MARGVYDRPLKHGPEVQAKVRRMAVEEGMSAHAIARALRLPTQTVWSMFQRLGLSTHRDPAPAGTYWDLLVAGTSLQGTEYPGLAA